MTSTTKKIVIVGGGYGGVAAATELDKLLGSRTDVEIILITKTEATFHNVYVYFCICPHSKQGILF